jgi:phage-related protein
VAAIAALTVGIILLIKHWDDVVDVLDKGFDAIKKAASSTLGWLKSNWPYIIGVLAGPLGLAAALVYKHWDKIRDVISDVVGSILRFLRGSVGAAYSAAANLGKTIKDGVVAGLAGIGNAVWGVIDNIWAAISNQLVTIVGWGKNVGEWVKSGVWHGLQGIGNTAWGVITGIWTAVSSQIKAITGWGESIGNWIKQGIIGALTGIGNWLSAHLKGAFNSVIRAWNKLKIPGFKIKGPGPLPDIAFPAIKFPDIPLLARGGIVTGPTLAMLGERGPEAVLPLSGGGAPAVNVRVFIGDTELRGLVRAEVRSEDNRTAQVLLAGAR